MPDHAHVFIAGLHRSGTSLLSRAIADHPEASSFSNTGFPEDEGQFLQRVYPVVKIYGGPGRFGFDRRSHLTERSPLVNEENRTRLRSEWGRHWDLSKRVLVEKSPPNLLKLRFLQAMFPDATFLVTMRHPIAVALATRKWSLTSVHALIRHWLVCHEIFLRDASVVRRLTATRYEALVAAPETVGRLQRAVGLSAVCADFEARSGVNAHYFREWASAEDPLRRLRHAAIARVYERRVNRFGYSLIAPERAVVPAPELRRLLLDR